MKIKTRTIILILLGTLIMAIIASFIFGYRNGRQRGDNASTLTIDSLNNQIYAHRKMLDEKALYIYEVKQELKSLKEAKSIAQIRAKELKALGLKKDVEVVRLQAKVDTLLAKIKHSGVVIIVDTVETMPRNAVLLPFDFEKKDEWLNLTGTFNKDGELNIDLKKDLFLDIWSGIKVGDKTPSIVLTTRDPYINVINISSIKTDTPKPSRHGVGLFVGYGLTKDFKGSPVVGIGLTRNLIRF